MKRILICFTLLALSHNIYATNFILGQSCALSGPTKDLGVKMKRGIDAFFKNHKEVTVNSLDDKYEPSICEKNTSKFITDNVTALIGYVGTPTAKVAVPLAMQAKKVFFGPFTGAGFLSDVAQNPYSFRVRASYDMETEMMVDKLTSKGINKIAIFIQDDGFGEVGKTGVVNALQKRNLNIVAEGRYKRNTIAIKGGADEVIKSKPEAVILIGAYRPCGQAIKYWKSQGLNVPFINISFVGSKALAQVVKDDPSNVYITQVVPNPWDASIPIVKEYQQNVGNNFEFIGLEGYITAKIMHKAIQKAGNDANNPDKLKMAIENLGTFDLGGLDVSFSATDHSGLSTTYLTKIEKDGSFKYINSIE